MKDKYKAMTREERENPNFVPCDHCTRNNSDNCFYLDKTPKNYAVCSGGYMVKETKKRAGKYERLLKAILKSLDIKKYNSGNLHICAPRTGEMLVLNFKHEQELIKIKEAMK